MKFKRFVFLLLTCFLANSGYCDDLMDYRYNPFQFVYPEYNYKADVIKIKKKTDSFNSLTRVSFFGLSAYVPSGYVDIVDNKNPEQVIVKSGKNIFFIDHEKELRSGCIDKQVALRNRDFCSAFESTKDLFYKFFTLTADGIKKTETPPPVGLLWIIHQKGILFESTKEIHIYEGDNFTAFVQVRKDIKTKGIAKDITVFHENLAPDHFSIGTNIKDDEFLSIFLETLQ